MQKWPKFGLRNLWTVPYGFANFAKVDFGLKLSQDIKFKFIDLLIRVFHIMLL